MKIPRPHLPLSIVSLIFSVLCNNAKLVEFFFPETKLIIVYYSQHQLSLDFQNGVRMYGTLNLRKFLSDSLDIAHLA